MPNIQVYNPFKNYYYNDSVTLAYVYLHRFTFAQSRFLPDDFTHPPHSASKSFYLPCITVKKMYITISHIMDLINTT